MGGRPERKKWSRNGSRVEPFSSPQDGPHLGIILVQLCKVVPFSTKKRLRRPIRRIHMLRIPMLRIPIQRIHMLWIPMLRTLVPIGLPRTLLTSLQYGRHSPKYHKHAGSYSGVVVKHSPCVQSIASAKKTGLSFPVPGLCHCKGKCAWFKVGLVLSFIWLFSYTNRIK